MADRVVARPLQRVAVKGRRAEFLVYELLGIVDSIDPETKASECDILLSRLTTEAMECLVRGMFAEARDRYENLTKQFPADKTARQLRDFAAKEATRLGLPAQGK